MTAGAVALALAPVAEARTRAVEHADAAGSVDPGVEVTATTANLSEALTQGPDLQWSSTPSGLPVIAVNAGTRYQTIAGFGER